LEGSVWLPKAHVTLTTELPPGSQVIDVTPHGASFWTQTAKLTINLADRSEQAYFLEVALGEDGMRMLNCEFESMTVLYTTVPEFAPKPYAWGSYKDIPDMHEFRSVSLHV
jgi:hypothetical protein